MELFETNKRMTQWLITIFDELKFNYISKPLYL